RKKGNIIPIYFHPRIETLPNNQCMRSVSCSLDKAIIREINAPKKELKIIPVKMIVSTRMERSTARANKITDIIVINAASILSVGKAYNPQQGRLILKNTVTTAPTEAPEETPRMYGSANGFFSKP